VPPHVERAHEIDNLMNEKAGSRDLDDEDIVDAAPEVFEVSDADEKSTISRCDDVKPIVKAEHTGPVARRPATNRISTDSSRTRNRNDSRDLLANISQVLDPSVRRARADENSINTVHTGQIFSLSGQLRESQRQLEVLRNQLYEAERRCHESERRADRAELMKIITESRSGSGRRVSRRSLTPGSSPRHSRDSDSRKSHRRHRRSRRVELYYADGGRSTQYVRSSDDEALVRGDNDSPGTRRYMFDEEEATSPTSPPCSSLQASSSHHNSQAPPHDVAPSPPHRSRSYSV
jgi:hypothetical protein